MLLQKSTEQWAVRQSLHDQFVFAHVNLRRTKPVSIKQALKNPERIKDIKSRKLIVKLLESEKKLSKIEEIIKDNANTYNLTDEGKIIIYYYTDEDKPVSAIRRQLDDTFNEKKIEKITDTGIQNILKNYLEFKGGDPKIAFSPEGIQYMNDNIELFNKKIL